MEQIPHHWVTDPNLAPAVAGMHWLRGTFPNLPVLSIIEMTFKPEFDIQDVSQPSGKLWQAVIEYLQTLPSLEAIWWGPSMENKQTFYLFLQWENAKGWQTFQNSFGIGLVVGLLAAPPFNRAVGMRAEFGFEKTLFLDSVLLQFDASISPQEKQSFQDQVPVIESSIAKACVKWLEQDVPDNPRSEVAPVIAAKQSHALVVLLPRKDLQDRSFEVDLLQHVSRVQAAQKITLCLFREEPKPNSKITTRPFTGQGIEALLRLPPCRKYPLELELGGLNNAIAYGKREALDSTRAFPAPNGKGYEPMANLNQYSTLKRLYSVSNQSPLLIVVEVCWLQFKQGHISEASSQQNGNAMKEFISLAIEIDGDSECEGVSWGHEEGSPDTLVMFINWKCFKTGTDILNTFSDTIAMERLTSRFTTLAAQPQFQRFPSTGKLSESRYLELASFYVPSGPRIKEVFEGAYMKFRRTISPDSTFPNDRFACMSLYPQCGGWEINDPIFQISGQEALRFTGAVSWNSVERRPWAAEANQPITCTCQEARAQWYKDFADGMEDYERLGKIMDALRCLTATDGVKSRVVTNVQPVPGGRRRG